MVVPDRCATARTRWATVRCGGRPSHRVPPISSSIFMCSAVKRVFRSVVTDGSWTSSVPAGARTSELLVQGERLLGADGILAGHWATGHPTNRPGGAGPSSARTRLRGRAPRSRRPAWPPMTCKPLGGSRPVASRRTSARATSLSTAAPPDGSWRSTAMERRLLRRASVIGSTERRQAWLLHPDDVGTQVGEKHGGVWAGADSFQFDDGELGQRAVTSAGLVLLPTLPVGSWISHSAGSSTSTTGHDDPGTRYADSQIMRPIDS